MAPTVEAQVTIQDSQSGSCGTPHEALHGGHGGDLPPPAPVTSLLQPCCMYAYEARVSSPVGLGDIQRICIQLTGAAMADSRSNPSRVNALEPH
jgi:hypothetical protein